MDIIGRKNEIDELQRVIKSNQSEFVVIYGRRRVGKTFLIREFFNNNFTFYVSGLSQAKMDKQITNFNSALRQSQYYNHEKEDAKDWLNAFDRLRSVLEASEEANKIIFIDELPWMDTKNSGLITAIEYFWNSWASARSDIKLIVCGSAASWMLEKLIKNKQGLYNRVTNRIKLKPFSLKETKLFFIQKGANYDHYQLVQLYMAFGGIPFYLNQVRVEESASQNINRLFFGESAKLRDEYALLFISLFTGHERHMKVIEALAKKKKGMQRDEILTNIKLKDGGSVSKIFDELEASDFIRKYNLPGKNVRNSLYQLTDNFTLFYRNFVKQSNVFDNQYWLNIINTAEYYSWAGNAFEIICLQHADEIRKALGISGIQVNTYAWSNKKSQIDLVLDRKDNVMNLIEAKFSINEYTITKQYAEILANKITEFKNDVPVKKAIWMVLITTFGLKSVINTGMIHSSLDMNIFFE